MILILLKTVLCSFLFLGIYHLVIAKTALHRLKRFYLLFALFISLAIPFINVKVPVGSDEFVANVETFTEPIIVALEGLSNSQIASEIAPEAFETITHKSTKPSAPIIASRTGLSTILAISIYTLITIILLLRLGRNIFRLFQKVKASDHGYYKGIKVIILQGPAAPFSFLNYIFISETDFNEKESKELLMTHEIGHVKQRHTIDILFLELLKSVLWFNPFYHFYGRAIRQNHEFLADAEVIKVHKNISSYQKLLFQFLNRTSSNHLMLTSPFNHSFTKRRFIMMTKKNSRTSAIARLSLLIPLLTITTMSFTFELVENLPVKSEPDGLLNLETIESRESDKPEIAPVDLVGDNRIVVSHGTTLHRGTDRMYDHDGVDFRAKLGSPVKAAGDGTVEIVSQGDPTYGNYIRLRHGDQYQTVYASLNDIKVEKGQTVKKGQVIGTVGKSIPDSNIHLHYEVIKNGNQVDPDEYFFFKHEPSFALFGSRVFAEVSGFKYKKKYGLDQRGTRALNFSNKSKYGKIIYDQEHIIFISQADELIKQLKMSDLSVEQVKALKGLKNGTFTYLVTHPKQEVFENWTDPREYMVVINGKLTKNSAMAQYKADDFSTFFSSKLRRNDPEKPKYRVDLYTNDFFENLVSDREKLEMDLVHANNKLIEIIDR